MNVAKLSIGTNQKIGRHAKVGNFNLPRVVTCPGATESCKAVCYARRGNVNFNNVRRRFELNFEGSKASGFVDHMVRQCRAVDIVRLHSAGDFYDNTYVDAWRAIAAQCPDTQFGAYTRSWRVPQFLPVLEWFDGLSNVHLFLSVDRSVGEFSPLRHFRLAHMVKDWSVDRYSVRCPNLVQHLDKGRPVKDCVTCSKCMICYREPNQRRHVQFKIH